MAECLTRSHNFWIRAPKEGSLQLLSKFWTTPPWSNSKCIIQGSITKIQGLAICLAQQREVGMPMRPQARRGTASVRALLAPKALWLARNKILLESCQKARWPMRCTYTSPVYVQRFTPPNSSARFLMSVRIFWSGLEEIRRLARVLCSACFRRSTVLILLSLVT